MQVSPQSMDINANSRRGQYQWMQWAEIEAPNQANQASLSTSPPTRPSSENNMTTPVDPLGIRYWPSSLRPARPPMSRPATIHEGAFPTYTSEPRSSSWNAPAMRMPSQYQIPPTSNSHELHYGSMDIANQKPEETGLDFSTIESDFQQFSQEMSRHDENAPIINLRKPSLNEHEQLSLDTSFSRRLSGSSFSMSSTAPTDLPDLSAYSEVPSYGSDYTPRSSLNLSATPLSPVPSPRCQPDLIRHGSRSRASPSPRPTMRMAPYSLDNTARTKRWSTGSYVAASPARRTSPFISSQNDCYFTGTSQTPNLNRYSSPIVPPTPTSSTTYTPVSTYTPNSAYPSNMALLPSANLNKTPTLGPNNPPPRFHRAPILLPSTAYDPNQTPTASHNMPTLFHTLHSNASPHSSHPLDPYVGLSDPPDLFGPLSSPPASPPPEDMTPQSPSMVPHEQELRFTGDLYTPKYVRGHGNKREGWCGICKPGRWLVLKNSAFWYDKSFTHGVSAATGQAFDSPRQTRRMEGNCDVWEGLCGSCNDWVALVSNKKKGTTWFRHAYKCHTHPKVKDVPKRRRESSHTRPSTAVSTSAKSSINVKNEPATPAMSTTSIVDGGANTTTTSGGMKTVSPLQSLVRMI